MALHTDDALIKLPSVGIMLSTTNGTTSAKRGGHQNKQDLVRSLSWPICVYAVKRFAAQQRGSRTEIDDNCTNSNCTIII